MKCVGAGREIGRWKTESRTERRAVCHFSSSSAQIVARGGGQQFSGGQPQFYAAPLCSVHGLKIVIFPPALPAEVLLLLD